MTPISWVVLGAVAALGVVFLAAALALFPVEVSVGALAAAVGASWWLSREGGKEESSSDRYRGER